MNLVQCGYICVRQWLLQNGCDALLVMSFLIFLWSIILHQIHLGRRFLCLDPKLVVGVDVACVMIASFPHTVSPFTWLLSIPLECLLPKHNFPTYMLCMAMHYLTFSSHGCYFCSCVHTAPSYSWTGTAWSVCSISSPYKLAHSLYSKFNFDLLDPLSNIPGQS